MENFSSASYFKALEGVETLFKTYLLRFAFRVAVFGGCAYFYFFDPSMLDINSNPFKDGIKPIHILWTALMIESLSLFIPRKNITVGRGKQFYANYTSTVSRFDELEFHKNISKMNFQALKVFAVWILINMLISLLYILEVFGPTEMIMISIAYFVGDLFCVLFFCPFQSFLMKNRCCINCRIYGWDHIMMYTPLLFIKSFFSWSLIFVSMVLLILWEYEYSKHPERFQELSNSLLRCENCRDKLCKIKKPIYNSRQINLKKFLKKVFSLILRGYINNDKR